MEALRAAMLAVSPLEAVAVVLGLAYVLLAARGNRWCWPAGGASAALYVWLSWRAALPMQAALQAWYVVMAVQGWRRWSEVGPSGVGWWKARGHVIAIAVLLVASLGASRVLQSQLQSGWPFVDSLTTLASLFAVWLTARMRLESWIYWFVIDALLVWLFAAQGLYATAVLFVIYLGICVSGWHTWHGRYRAQTSAA